MRFAILAAFVLLAASLVADASRNVPQSPPANAQALAAFNQWSKMRRSLASSASSPTAAADMTICPGDNHAKPYFWPIPTNKLYMALTGKSACASLPAYVPSHLPVDLDFTKDFELGLFGTMQEPKQLQYTIGEQTVGWNLTTELPELIPTDKLSKPIVHELMENFVPTAAQCDVVQLQQQCQAMCKGMATHFQPLCPNAPLAMQSAESVVCGFTQMSGSDSKCLDACKAVECVQ